MAITEAFPGPSAVVDSLELRKNLAGLIVRDTAGVPRAGVFPRHTNALVSSTATMSVNVAAFEAALVRTGPLFVQNDGTVAVTIATAPVSNSRIDVVWARQPENGYNGFADGSNVPLISVTAGTAAASPVKPAIPAGALELATVLVPAGATATNSGGVVITQTFQYTATAGGVVAFRTLAEMNAVTTLPNNSLATVFDTPRSLYQSSAGVWRAVMSGLVPLRPATVVGGTITASGLVTFSAATTVSLNGVFSSAFSRYVVRFARTTASASSSVYARMRLAGTDAVAALDYNMSVTYRDTGAVLGGTTGGQTYAQLDDLATTGKELIVLDVLDPAAADATILMTDWTKRTSATSTARGTNGGAHVQTVAYDGITIYPNSGNFTGTVQVFGYFE